MLLVIKCFFVCLLAKGILGVATENEDTSNFVFEDEIMEFLEELRKIMKEGDAENGIPPMEPARFPNYNIDFYLEDTDLKGMLRNTVVHNLSDFEVKNLTLDLKPKMELKLKVLFDQIFVTGYYDLSGLIFGEYPIRGVGTYKVKLNGLTLSAEMGFRTKAAVLNIRHLNATFDVGGISVSYKNLLEGDYEQSFKEEFLLHLLDRFRAEYLPRLLNTLKVVINDFLERESSKDEDTITLNLME